MSTGIIIIILGIFIIGLTIFDLWKIFKRAGIHLPLFIWSGCSKYKDTY